MKGMFGVFYKIADWVMRLAYVNILWIAFTLLGLIVFGFFPATAGMFSVVRKWLNKEEDVPVFKTFWDTYRSEFIKVNLFGLMFFIIGLVLYYNLRIVQIETGIIYTLLFFSSGIILLFTIGAFLFFFPIYVHFDLSPVQYIKHSILIPPSKPIEFLFMVAGVILVYMIMEKVPGLLPFYSGSSLAVILMYYGMRAFRKIDQANEEMEEEQ